MLSYTTFSENVPIGSAGCARGPFITIRPKYKDDIGLWKHEDRHTTHWWIPSLIGIFLSLIIILTPELSQFHEFFYVPAAIGMTVYGLAYKFIWQFRLWAEVDCYKLQNTFCPVDRRKMFTRFVYESYDLAKHITEEEIYKKMCS